mmetsp:Transcript_33568/g.80311  ORF Transcript_33568/g.80311 Transcript_33568/m.80311 type:complete len:167 (-) Transcript_33568:612-1112(-)
MVVEGLLPLPLLGGLDADELWPVCGLVLPTWALLAFAPRWAHTPTLTLVSPVLHAAIYALGVLSVFVFGGDASSEVDFNSLEGVVTLFKDPNVVFVGWIHYICYDALVGRWVVMDSIERGASAMVHVFAIVPCLFFCLMWGPVGFLIYIGVVRPFVLTGQGKGKTA